jgi:hypothetical protein
MMNSGKSSFWRCLRRLFGRKNGHASSETALLSEQAFQQAMRRERSRADRAGFPFSLIVLSGLPAPGGTNGSDKRACLVRAIDSVLAGRIRCTDIAGWLDESRLGVILAHTPGQEAWNVVEDVQRKLPAELEDEGLSGRLDYRVHTYPEDQEVEGRC